MPTTSCTRAVSLLLVLAIGVLGAASAGDAGAATRGSSGCGRTAAAGVTTRRVTIDGMEREYLLSIPKGYDASKPAPLLFDFHGLASDMQEQALYTGLDERGGARGYVVITPNGQGDVLRHWSLLASASSNPDVAFVQEMLRTANRTLCIDRRRIFSTGISNGAMFSTLLACVLPGRLAAIAPVAGINATEVCDPKTPRVGVLAFHGTADPIVPFAGGEYFSGAPIGRVLGVPPAKPVPVAMAAWAAFDGCRRTATKASVGDDVEHLVWPGCRGHRVVELYEIAGGGHTWPGAPAVREERLGRTTATIDATRLVLDFFDASRR